MSFSSKTPSGGLFGNPQRPGYPFSKMAGSGAAAAPAGTAHVKYEPLVGTDVVIPSSGASRDIKVKHHCITCMKEYESKSLEELRLEDYKVGRMRSSAMFGSNQPEENKPLFGFNQPLFGSNQPLFGSNQPLFGSNQPLFGSNQRLFGSNQPEENKPLFGFNQPLFGSNQPLFGSNQPLFGSNQPPSTFGAPATSAAPSVFGGGGTLGTSGGFGQPSSGLFGEPSTKPLVCPKLPTFNSTISNFNFGSSKQESAGGPRVAGKPSFSFGSFGSTRAAVKAPSTEVRSTREGWSLSRAPLVRKR